MEYLTCITKRGLNYAIINTIGAGLPTQYHPIATWLPRIEVLNNLQMSEQVTKII